MKERQWVGGSQSSWVVCHSTGSAALPGSSFYAAPTVALYLQPPAVEGPPASSEGRGEQWTAAPLKASGSHSRGCRQGTVARLLADVLQKPQH